MNSNDNQFSLQGKTVLVTGASSGIGRSIAITCSKMGASVVAVGRDEKRLSETLSLLDGYSHVSFRLDLTQINDYSDTIERFPKLDGIVHCAGIRHLTVCKMITAEDIDTQFDVNFKGPVLLQSSLLSRKKVKKGASIVFIASLAYAAAGIGNAIYSATKGAIISYANCLKVELAPRLIRVNCISPAMIQTDMIHQHDVTEDMLEADQQTYLFKTYGTPNDVANLTVYLLSDASRWMTGSNIELTGGAPKI